jgi:hypothetical protein
MSRRRDMNPIDGGPLDYLGGEAANTKRQRVLPATWDERSTVTVRFSEPAPEWPEFDEGGEG